MLANKLMSAALSGGAEDKLYVDDVFSTYLYTGNGATQTINNGIDLAGKGGLVWEKFRSGPSGTGAHVLADTVRGVGKYLSTNTTSAQVTSAFGAQAFLANGFKSSTYATNDHVVSHTFRRSPKFFDVVTYTGNGGVQFVNHSLGIRPGMIVVKRTDGDGDWAVWHVQSQYGTHGLKLNLTVAALGTSDISSVDTTRFGVSTGTIFNINTSGAQYVAYLIAHDDSEDGIIQCGSFTTDASGNATVNLGWEPQYVLWKSSSQADNWHTLDSMRGWPAQNPQRELLANSSTAESDALWGVVPTATGLKVTGSYTLSTQIYLAIRRPNKPPTSGWDVYSAVARTGNGSNTVVNAGITPDSVLIRCRNLSAFTLQASRLTDNSFMYTGASNSGGDQPILLPAGMFAHPMSIAVGADYLGGTNASGQQYINHFFRRAPGFFDVVCDTGTGAAHAVAHNLTVAPELVIRKSRSASSQWEVWHSALSATEKLVLHSPAAKVTDTTAWNSTAPGASSLTVGTGANVNSSGATFVTHLWATLAGVSKVGSYTGNGTSQTISCGFTTGARFILIKRTDAAGDWYVWDSARGIVSGNDPHLSLNTTVAEVTTDDSVDTDPLGFVVNQVAATDINVSGASYIYFSVA